ncbi:hypothetical protein ACSTKK_00020, partial [Vibrio parahaemolyticus]
SSSWLTAITQRLQTMFLINKTISAYTDKSELIIDISASCNIVITVELWQYFEKLFKVLPDFQ